MKNEDLKIPITDKAIIEGLLPQKEPFVFVDALFEIVKESAAIGFAVSAEHILIENHYLSEAGLLEHIAQSAALQSGYRKVSNGNKMAKKGFLIAFDKVKIHRLPKVGEVLTTTIKIEGEFMQMQMFSFETHQAKGKLLAKGSLKTAVK